jgi:hypothetical protein
VSVHVFAKESIPLKTAFSSIKDHAAAAVSDEAFAQREDRWPLDTPDTKEGYFIREIFEGTLFA